LAAEVRSAAQLHGSFTLRSGAGSDSYFDKVLIESDPELSRALVEVMAPLVPHDTDVLAGLELGGIPVVTVLSQITGLPAVFVRKQSKPYGTRKLVDGCRIAGRTLTLVEDVVTSGGQIALSTTDLRAAGAKVEVAGALVDRRRGGDDVLGESGCSCVVS
jgi:orotate phosphoribosyltransferase